uniref:TNF receptor superfamily member 25 n=1 Tax=Sciurus vulgaris TaxID=55149 RepID=A0A8D2AQ38_SCIVU
MEPRPGGCVAAVAAAVLLLLGVPGQGSIPGPRCDCTSDFQRRNGPPCCRGCPVEKAGTEALTPPQATHLSSCESAHTLLVLPGSSGKVCPVQLVGNSWTPDAPQTQEVPYQQMPQSWAQQPGRELGPPLAPPLSPAPYAGSPAAVLQPGPQLYDVMDAVPARRWKEFVRTLGLREAEIEAVEVEIGRFRDQQYEMLKRWRQQQPAGLGAVYAALERMGLDGCAEDLRSRLQQRGS